MQVERPFKGLVRVSSLITLMLSLPTQELVQLDVFRPVFQGYSWWREVLSHPSGWMVWKAAGDSVLAS